MSNKYVIPEHFTDRSLIESILSSFFILDYGIVNEVNGDNTINVLHSKKLTMLDGSVLPPMETKNIEVLTLSGTGFSIVWDIQKGDKVLLLGLKMLIEKSADVNTPEESKSNLHYSRETLKAFPLCAFNDSAKVKIQIKDGAASIIANDKINTECKEYKISVKLFLGNGSYFSRNVIPIAICNSFAKSENERINVSFLLIALLCNSFIDSDTS